MISIYTMTEQHRKREIKRSVVTLGIAVLISIAMLAYACFGVMQATACIGTLLTRGATGIRAMYARHKALIAAPVGTVVTRMSNIIARAAQIAGQSVEAVGQAARQTAYQTIVHALSRIRARLIDAITISRTGLVHTALISARTTSERATAG